MPNGRRENWNSDGSARDRAENEGGIGGGEGGIKCFFFIVEIGGFEVRSESFEMTEWEVSKPDKQASLLEWRF